MRAQALVTAIGLTAAGSVAMAASEQATASNAIIELLDGGHEDQIGIRNAREIVATAGA